MIWLMIMKKYYDQLQLAMVYNIKYVYYFSFLIFY